MRLTSFLAVSSTLILLTACSKPEPQVVTVPEIIEKTVPLAQRPAKPELYDNFKLYIVTEDNLEEFKERFIKNNGELVFAAMSIRDYENISLNMAEIQSYIQKQDAVIVYYEDALSTNK